MSIEAVKQALDGKSLYEITGRIEDIDKCIVHRSVLYQAIEEAEQALAQPAREPLTDEQVEKIIKANMMLTMNFAGIRVDLEEAAHGIKEQE